MSLQLETLATALDYIPRLNKGIAEAVTAYREGNDAGAYELLVQIIDGLNWLLDVIQLTKAAQKTPIDLEGIEDLLSEMIEGLENQDSVLLADLLEYELLEKTQGWQATIRLMLAS